MSSAPSISDLLDFDLAAVGSDYGRRIIGVDEVGRGCLAGPLVAGAVLLDLNGPDLATLEKLGDSKRLTEKRREQLFPVIKDVAIAYSLVERAPAWIDENGIEAANQGAMLEAIEILLAQAPEALVVVDGNGLRAKNAPKHRAIVKGDGKSAAIACASVLAKVSRDRQMVSATEHYPAYSFESNKGYGSAAHKQALYRYGLTPLHRKSFCRFLNIDVGASEEVAEAKHGPR